MTNGAVEEKVDAPTAEREGLLAYGDDDDSATQHFEAASAEPRWLVQITPFDRRTLHTAELVAGLLEGTCIHRSTLVWRDGMRDWARLDTVLELGPAGLGPSRPPARAPGSGAPSGSRSAPLPPSAAVLAPSLVLAPAAVAVAVAAATLATLAAAGVFEPAALPALLDAR